MCLKIITFISAITALLISVIILIKINHRGEHFAPLFPQPDKRVMKGSIDCAYALDGSNTAYCNDWIKSHREGKLCQTDDGCHPNSFGKVCCDSALKCCNQIATCGGGNDCRNPKYTPTKNNNLMYDQNIYIDQ